MERRDFVLRIPVVATGLLGAASGLSLAACGGVPLLVPRGTADRLVVAAADVPPSGILLQLPEMEWPVYVRAEAGAAWVALLARCTHRGCQPDPVGDRLVCPCHGSEYDLLGRVLEGPAERPLTRFPVSVEGDDLVIVLTGGGR
ncbi:MAG TPA: Rieske (2Fe-2S) protein [Longimicrobiales bacterium]|jgi:cytochrome b6-f complex iron-sulfur subunit